MRSAKSKMDKPVSDHYNSQSVEDGCAFRKST
jgi:hypothetical protein